MSARRSARTGFAALVGLALVGLALVGTALVGLALVGSQAARADDAPDETPTWKTGSVPSPWKDFRLTLDGYLRVRGEAWNDLDLSRGPTPTTHQPIFPLPAAGGTDHNLTAVDMRVRLEPTLELGQAVRLHLRVDLLDNVGFGSTPDVLGSGGYASASLTAESPEAGVNAQHDAVRVKQAWGEVVLPFGTLAAGRMGGLVSWGTGFFVNNGDCLSCDHGDTGDRIALTVPILGHYLTALYELSASGPYANPYGQNIDLDSRAHVDTYALALARYDSPLAQKRKLAAGRTLLQYGHHGSYRSQELDAPGWTQPGGVFRSYGPADFVRRGTSTFAADLWLLFHRGGLRAEIELATVIGKIDDASNIPGVALRQAITSRQIGGVGSIAYQLGFPLRLRFEVGYASGDDGYGFGLHAAPGQTSTQPGDLDGPKIHPPVDTTVDNFRFHPDYHVDLILWRRIVGQVTDAIYLKPSLKLGPLGGPTSHISLEVSAIDSHSIVATTPPGQDTNLGVELDGQVRYRYEPAFEIGLTYGLFLPGAGFRNLALHLDPQPAQALEIILAFRI